MENKNIKLYKLRDDGSIGLKEVNRGMFKDSDSFSQALDFYYENGYCDSREEAKNKALEMMKKMNEDFCGKHEFDVQEMFTSYVISFYNPARDNCCGNGCCM